ncbi:MAG: hypothetical protein MUQ00_13320 [Candidatus Aminicenantes bacterium]|nr:hypothetical protein [Candidatus Aminicenantes bacterium]
MRIRKVLIKASIFLLAILTVGLSIRAVLNYTMGRKLQHYLAQAKADGVPLTHRDLAPTCDDTDNAAVLWKAAEILFEPIPSDRAVLNKTLETIFNGEPINEASRATRDRLIEKNRRVLEFINEASQKTCFRFGDWTKPFYFIGQPNAIKLIQAVRLLGIDAVLRAESGQAKGGLEQCRLGMNFVRKLMDEPMLFQTLIALVDMKSLLICFNRIASGRDLDSETLSAWIKEMDVPSWRKKFARCAQSVRIFSLEHGLGLIRGDQDVLAEADKAGIGGKRFFYWLARPFLKAEIVWRQGQFLEVEQRIGMPFFRIKEMDRDPSRKPKPAPWYLRLPGILSTDFESVFLKEAAFEALMLTTKAGLACKIYKNINGRYPENLEALVPEILDELPIDPFTGKPLVCKVENNGLLIYSFGSNEKDDGGRSTYAITQLVMEKDDDWAWREKLK